VFPCGWGHHRNCVGYGERLPPLAAFTLDRIASRLEPKRAVAPASRLQRSRLINFFSGGYGVRTARHADNHPWPSATRGWWTGCPVALQSLRRLEFGRSCATPGFDLLAFLKRRLFVFLRVSLFGHELAETEIPLDASPILIFSCRNGLFSIQQFSLLFSHRFKLATPYQG